jgi:DNA-binding SARP family transcriptional activator
MIELSLLGRHALRDSDGRELTSLLAQPKRFALLSYLAIGSGSGYSRRDTLAAMFWPELDQFAARRALRNILYHLREALGDGVIVTRGDDAVAIDPTRLTCDVTRLSEAVAAGRYEDAVDGYHGELLAGLHFANAGETFEEWLSGERRRATELVMRAVGKLVEREQGAGHLLAAARWAQRACALAPGDESWLRLYESVARRLAAELDTAPPAESPPAPGPVSIRTEAPAPPAIPALPGRSGRGMYWAAGCAAVLVMALLVRAASAGHRRPAPASKRVLVEVFDNRTGDSGLASLGRMAQDWLAQGFLRTHLVDVVDPRAVFEQSRAGGSNRVDPVTLARRTGSALVVSGSYYRSQDTLFLEASVTDARTGRIARVVGPIASSAHTPVAGLDELRSRVMTALATLVDVHATQSLDLSAEVPPFEAYQAFVEGNDAYWHGDGQRAVALFLQAAHRDTLFAAASIAAAAVAANINDCALIDSLDQALQARRQRLERVDRLSLEIAVARCHGRNDEMLRLALERADLTPHTSNLQLAAAAAALWANRPQRALDILQRLDPETDLGWSTDTTHFDYWSDLTEALHLLGRHDEELAAADRVPRTAPLTRAWLRGRALAALARPTAALVLLDSALSLPVETSIGIGLAPYTDGRPQYDATPGWVAWWIADELAIHGDTVAARQAATRGLTWYRNRPDQERATFEERLVATWSLEIVGAYADAEHIARQLLAEDSDNVDVRGELAGLAAERRDTVLADSLDRWLGAQPVARVSWTASLYRARVAARRGQLDAAFARTVEAWDEGAWPMWIHQDPAFATLHTRRDFVALTAPRD